MDPAIAAAVVGGFFSMVLWLGQRTTKSIDNNILKVHTVVEKLADELTIVNRGIDDIKEDLKNNYVTRREIDGEFLRVDRNFNEMQKAVKWYELNVEPYGAFHTHPNIQRIQVWKPESLQYY